MSEYPRFSRFQILLTILSALVLLGFTVYLFVTWSTLAEVLPSHYGIDGTADAWSSKASSITVPILGWGIYIALTVLLFIPRMWKVPHNHHDIGRQLQIYRSCRSLLCVLTFAISVMFVYIGVCTVHNNPLGLWFLPAIVVGSILINVIFLARMPRKSDEKTK